MNPFLSAPPQYPSVSIKSFGSDVDMVIHTMKTYPAQAKQLRDDIVNAAEKLNKAIQEHL